MFCNSTIEIQQSFRQSIDVLASKSLFSEGLGQLFRGVGSKYLAQIWKASLMLVGPRDQSPDISIQSMIDTYQIRMDQKLVFLGWGRSFTFLRLHASSCENLVSFGLVDFDLWSMQVWVFNVQPSSYRYVRIDLVRIGWRHVMTNDVALSSRIDPLFMPSDRVFLLRRHWSYPSVHARSSSYVGFCFVSIMEEVLFVSMYAHIFFDLIQSLSYRSKPLHSYRSLDYCFISLVDGFVLILHRSIQTVPTMIDTNWAIGESDTTYF